MLFIIMIKCVKHGKAQYTIHTGHTIPVL